MAKTDEQTQHTGCGQRAIKSYIDEQREQTDSDEHNGTAQEVGILAPLFGHIAIVNRGYARSHE